MKHKKKLLCIALSLIVATSAVYAAYQRPKEVQAAFAIDDTILMLALLASAGVVLITGWPTPEARQDAVDKWGEENIGVIDDQFADYLESKEHLVDLINLSTWHNLGLDGDDGGDDDDDGMTTWEKLKAWVNQHPGEMIASTGIGLTAIMLEFANWVKGEADLFRGDETNPTFDFKADFPADISHDLEAYPYMFSFNNNKLSTRSYVFTDVPCFMYHETTATEPYYSVIFPRDPARYYVYVYSFADKTFKDPVFKQITGGSGITCMDKYLLEFISNYAIPIFNSKEEGQAYWDSVNGNYNINNENVKYGSSMQPDDSGSIVALPVSQINLQNFADNYEKNYSTLLDAMLQKDETKTQAAVDTIIDSVGADSSTDPEPDDGTTPDDGTGDNTGTGTGTGSGIGTLPDVETESDLDGNMFLLPEEITEKFPFCVPFDIIRAFSVLESSSRAAPKITLPLKAERYDINYELDIDLSVFDEVAALLRNLELILFVVGLALVSRDLIKG